MFSIIDQSCIIYDLRAMKYLLITRQVNIK